MGFVRNPEIKKEAVAAVLLIVLSVVAAYILLDVRAATLVFCVAALFSILHFMSSYKRYRKISNLANQLDRFLHDYAGSLIDQQEEGELAILQSEISKLILRLKNQAEQLTADKVYLSDSIADISHQIRTPLTSINLLVSRLSVLDLSKEKRSKLLQELEERLQHIDWLIQALLKISKLDAGTVQMLNEKVSVRQLIQRATAAIEIPMELRGQELQVDCPSEIAFMGDLAWSTESLSNIVKNCMEHTPEGGYVKIAASENALFTEIMIEDNGSGIAKEDLPRLFERFYKGKNSSEKSVGIGLALSRMIIIRQNGTVTAENRKEGGARFVLRFYKTTI